MKHPDEPTALCQRVCAGGEQLWPPGTPYSPANSCAVAIRCPTSCLAESESGHLSRVASATFVHAANYARSLRRLSATRKTKQTGRSISVQLSAPYLGSSSISPTLLFTDDTQDIYVTAKRTRSSSKCADPILSNLHEES